MYDRRKAKEAGWIFRCEADLEEPVTTAGYYKCKEGHAHLATWNGGQLSVSKTGYDWAFLGALEVADEKAIAVANPETEQYNKIHDVELTARGYGAAVLRS
ncbi:MAG TPA: hypothetical protein VF747_12990 [Blastocatellia bacterium]|jgi:hypothetical protein